MSTSGVIDSSGKVVSLEAIGPILDIERAQGRTVAMCHGVFDLLHPGHFRHLRSARSTADVLVVTVTGDKFVGKGPGRPAFSQDLRAEALASLESVNFVVIIEDATAAPAITAVLPNVYVKGQEYAEEADDPTGNIRRERELVESNGGRVFFTDDIVFSSSKLINAFLPQHSEGTQKWLADLRAQYDARVILEWLDRLQGLRILLVGETILDVYTSCQALGKASKEPVLCLNRGDSVTQGGGILAIAAHCAGLGAAVTVVTGVNSRDADCEQLADLRALGVSLQLVWIDPSPTVRKERLVDSNTRSRILEIYQMDDRPLDGPIEDDFLGRLSAALEMADAALIADYGHGLMTDRAIEMLCSSGVFVAVNAQTNAGNHGFNSISKYSRADFATLNGSEARLEVRRRHANFDDYMPELRDSLKARSLLVTQGGAGIDLYLADGHVERSPALAPFVLDRVGAGDAVLAATALLSCIDAPPPVVAFIGNLVGAWAVSFLGNERTLQLGDLKRQITATLK